MGKDAAEIRMEFHSRLGQMARELARELYPDGLLEAPSSRNWKPSPVALADEMARQLIEINVREQADDWPENELGECPTCGGAARRPRRAPRAHDHAGRRGLETTSWQLPPLSAGFFSLKSSSGH